MGHTQLLYSSAFIILRVKDFFLIPNLNLPSFGLKLLHLVLPLQVLVKNLSPSFLKPPFKYWKAAMMSLQSVLQAQQPQPILTGIFYLRDPTTHLLLCLYSLWGILVLDRASSPSVSQQYMLPFYLESWNSLLSDCLLRKAFKSDYKFTLQTFVQYM